MSVNYVRVEPQSGGKIARFTFSYDVADKLLKCRDGRKAKMNAYWNRGLHLVYMTFADTAMPAVFVYLDQIRFGDKSPYPKFTQSKKRFQFVSTVSTRRIRLKPTFKTQRLRLLWIKKPAGLMLMFQDGDMDLGEPISEFTIRQ